MLFVHYPLAWLSLAAVLSIRAFLEESNFVGAIALRTCEWSSVRLVKLNELN